MHDLITTILWVAWLTLATYLFLASMKCVFCDDNSTELCKNCKNYRLPNKATNYEPKEFDISKETLKKFNEFTDEDKEKIVAYWNKRMSPALSNLAEQINNLSEEEFIELDKQVKHRGYEDGRD